MPRPIQQFNLHTLQALSDEFSLNLFIHFVPTETLAAAKGAEELEDTFYPITGQYHDLLDAYYFAKTNLLPTLRNILEHPISSAAFLESIKKIHQHIGYHLLKSSHEEESVGRYTNEIIFRWHFGTHFFLDLQTHLQNEHSSRTKFITSMVSKHSLSPADLSHFLDILNLVYASQDPRAQIHPSQKQYIAHKMEKDVVCMHKLFSAYHHLLTPEQKAQIDNFVGFCSLPEDIPDQMNDFAEATLGRFQILLTKTTSYDEIAAFLAEFIYEMDRIHPFVNANARTATCVMNVFLRCFNLPSMLLCDSVDKDNEDSLYSRAFHPKTLSHSRIPLTELIKTKIEYNLSQLTTPPSEINLKALNIHCLRVQLSDLLQTLPNTKASAIYREALNETNRKIEERILNEGSDATEAHFTTALQKTQTILSSKPTPRFFETTTTIKVPPTSSTAEQEIAEQKIKDEKKEKEKIGKCMMKLTGVVWQVDMNHNSPIAWRYVGARDDKRIQQSIDRIASDTLQYAKRKIKKTETVTDNQPSYLHTCTIHNRVKLYNLYGVAEESKQNSSNNLKK